MVGIETDEPAQCKMSFKHSITFEKMDPIYFGSSTYKYYHSALLTYPKDINITDNILKLGEAGQGYKLYVRCIDAIGNDNENDYVIKFDIEKGPDLTAPVIETTSLGTLGTSTTSPTERYLSLGANTTDIILYLNEAATCKWSNSDLDYAAMPAENECTSLSSNKNDGLYACEFNSAKKKQGTQTVGESLKGFDDAELKYYYFRCKDNPSCTAAECKHNVNAKSSVLALRKSYPLNISEIIPSGDVYIGGVGGNVTLEVRTEGGAEKTGKAYCGFVTGEANKNNVWGMSAFFETNSSRHLQLLSQLSTGAHRYYVGCVDVAGNTVYGETTFNLALDTEGPGIIRAFIDSTSGTDLFKIKTDEKSTCEYSTTGTFKYGEGNEMLSDDGLIHSAQGGISIYYVLCTDQFNNIGSLTTVNFLTQ